MAVFTNQATLTYNGNVINSNIVSGEITEVLSANKTAVIETYSDGSFLTYVVNIVNSGATAFTGLTITDDLGTYTFGALNPTPLTYIPSTVKYYINGTLQATPVVNAGPPLVISGINVPAGGTATVIYGAQVNDYAPLEVGSTIENTAVISGGGAADITVNETVTVISAADLAITKSISPATVNENGTVTYTFVIENSGNTPVVATDTVVIADTFDPALSGITVTFNGVTWTEGVNYTYNETTGLFETALGQVTVPAATYTQDAATGVWTTESGASILTITGTI